MVILKLLMEPVTKKMIPNLRAENQSGLYVPKCGKWLIFCKNEHAQTIMPRKMYMVAGKAWERG